MKRAICALILLLASRPALAETSPAQFAGEMIARLKAAHPESIFANEGALPLQVTVKGGGHDGAQIMLYRIYDYCRNVPAESCEASKADFVAKVLVPLPEARRENLRVIVRGADYYDAAQQQGSKEKRQPWFFARKIGDDLYEILALDSPTQIALANSADLKRMRLRPEAAWSLARTQTWQATPPLPDPASLLAEAAVFEGKEYVGSMLADTQGWQAVREAIGPDLFVTVTSDQFVMVSLMAEGPGLDRFAEAVAADCRGAERCISPHVYRFEQGMWVIEK
ncbi:MAG: hypothetical protein H6916_11915 [Novosphingobium sp.]|uniref:hypothetical protein n=1 Tax=Novosphingobium sp. TaxID=1874826 RepID=UPI001D31A841|nr:hypothetical protein [Novosphingobium sp.]MCB2058124.1 hypothetical protein [Novosphingobium sp.]MCP5387500.1 hypothetical protein [Novosphingobium sp.]